MADDTPNPIKKILRCSLRNFEYFYGQQSEQFIFYRIPKALFTDKRFFSMSYGAKLLYGLMLDRMGLSQKEGWFDKQNRVYIYFTLDEIMERLHCAKEKASKLMSELGFIGLIEIKRQGLGKPNIIYVKDFAS